MAVPRFHEWTLPILRHVRDGQTREVRRTCDEVADIMDVPDEDRDELLPSGHQTRLYNRFQWAVSYLVQAGLLERPRRGFFRITDRGRRVLEDPPEEINREWLMRFEEFRDFRNRSKKRDDADSGATVADVESDDANDDRTPQELVETGISQIDTELADELLDHMKKADPAFFEQLVIDVLVAMGYGGSRADAAQAVGRSGDAGIDGIIKEDRLGLDVIYVQAKRWENAVGRPEVQAFAGSLEGHRARKGVFITTSTFAQPAKEYVARIEKKIILIDGRRLARLMIEHDVGVTTVST